MKCFDSKIAVFLPLLSLVIFISLAIFQFRPFNKTRYYCMGTQTSQQSTMLWYVYTDLSTKPDIIIGLHRLINKAKYCSWFTETTQQNKI